MKKTLYIILLFCLMTTNINLKAQNFSLDDLIMLEKSSMGDIANFLVSKGWQLEEDKKSGSFCANRILARGLYNKLSDKLLCDTLENGEIINKSSLNDFIFFENILLTFEPCIFKSAYRYKLTNYESPISFFEELLSEEKQQIWNYRESSQSTNFGFQGIYGFPNQNNSKFVRAFIRINYGKNCEKSIYYETPNKNVYSDVIAKAKSYGMQEHDEDSFRENIIATRYDGSIYRLGSFIGKTKNLSGQETNTFIFYLHKK